MTKPTQSRALIIEARQNEQLYSRLIFSALGTIVVATTIQFIIRPHADVNLTMAWFCLILLVSGWRWFIALRYYQASERERNEHLWKKYFDIGTYLAAIAWGLALWMCYPQGHPEYEILLLLAIAGIAGGALAIQSFDKALVTSFLVIIMVSVELRLLTGPNDLAYELAFLNLLYYLFLIKGGRDIGDSYYEMLMLRQDAEEHNIALLTTAEQVAKIGYWQWDLVAGDMELSSNLMTMSGLTKPRIALAEYLHCVHKDDQSRMQHSIESVLETGIESVIEYRMRNPQQDNWLVMNQVAKKVTDSGQNQFLLGTVQDISAIKSAEQKIFDMAYFDELTGLANRGHFRQHLSDAIKQADRNHLSIAVLYLDLDGFKEINDTFGHERGDEFLKEFSLMLKHCIRAEDFIARLGGDEFCIIQYGVKRGVEVGSSAERCLRIKQQNITIEGRVVSPKMSIGIALYPQDGKDVDTLLRAADTAMYTAKRKGKQCFEFYDAQMTKDAAARLELDSDLTQALENDEFILLYQPKVSLLSRCMTGVEALIRWIHPERGMVPPDEFIDAAERNGLIQEIGEWVLEQACLQQQRWQAQNIKLEMAVNISSSHFSSDQFLAYIRDLKDRLQFDDGVLEVEITESLTRDPQQHIEISKHLHAMGIRVAIDDFGTGYSSLSVLRQLKADTLKIDRAFIRHLPDDQTSALLVKSITTMAIGLGYDVVAEGVETEAQAEFLKNMGNPYVQGYLYSRPVEADRIPQLVESMPQRQHSDEDHPANPVLSSKS